MSEQNDVFRIIRRRGPLDHYRWRNDPDVDSKAADPTKVGLYLENKAAENGGILSTSDLVADAARLESPLYPLVEHDIEVAADNWQMHQMRKVIGSLIYVKVTSDVDVDGKEQHHEIEIKGFHNVITNGMNHYTPVVYAARVPELKNQIENKLLAEAKAWANRAKEFRIFAGVVEEIASLPPLEARGTRV